MAAYMMLPKWHPEHEDGAQTQKTVFRKKTALSRFCANPFSLLKTTLAIVGVVLLLERSASFYASHKNGTVSDNVLDPGQSLHPMDDVFVHSKHNTGTGSHGRKALIVASTSKEDTSWVREHFPDWEINIYVVDDRHADLTIAKNRGREASVYLTYVLNHYYNLPDYMVFLHANRYQWHNDDPMYDGVNPVKNLRLEYVKEVGYASLRCTWNPGCPTGLKPNASDDEGFFGMTATYAKKFAEFFPDEDVPTEVSTTCCAQFAVTRDAVLLRKTSELESVRQWLWDTGIQGQKTGRVLEYMWHIMMGKPAVLCPSAQACFCKTFGYCNLTCPAENRCEGRFSMPAWGAKFPVDWPTHGQGEHGFPKYGWWQKWYPEETWGLEYTVINPAQVAAVEIITTETDEEAPGPGDFDLDITAEDEPDVGTQ